MGLRPHPEAKQDLPSEDHGSQGLGRSGATPLARIQVRGLVQGVGFRPFVYNLAQRHGLKGWVCNTSEDVRIEVEGSKEAIECFLRDLKDRPPPMAVIEQVSCQWSKARGYRSFEIRTSRALKGRSQMVSPDIATCHLCQRELFDPKDRRYRYPFINCTNCGPRFTIIRDIPYDRPNTTMDAFEMCADCRKEYEDPGDRRFHAEPIACPACGPRLELVDPTGWTRRTEDPILSARNLLGEGKILAIKGLGGFLLACDATNDQAVELLRRRKRRPSKPFAVMMPSIHHIRRYCSLSPEEEALLHSPPSPIVLLERKPGTFFLSQGVAPNLRHLGVMLPYTPLHHLLMREVDRPLVMTSGNLSEEPIAKDNDEALRRLGSIADAFLLHDRDIHARYDDSVAFIENGRIRIVRRARGYAPFPIRLPFESRETLACGADLKNTFCLTRGDQAFLSPHIGDLDHLESLKLLEETVESYQALFRARPEIVAHDLHPDYHSTRYARGLHERDRGVTLVPVQHHHAHIVSAMTENRIEPPAIGIAFDGTGYGVDGHIWGGEFLIADYRGFRRMGHLEYVPMPGGEVAIRKPYRMAIAYLLTLLGEPALERDLPFLDGIERIEIDLIRRQIERGIHSPLTSSAGRLFDGVASLLGLRQKVDYEAQAAIELEAIADEESCPFEAYPVEIEETNGIHVVRLRGLFSGILEDLFQNTPNAVISARFHLAMARIVAEMAERLARSAGIRRTVLSGGVFQNRLLSQLAATCLEEKGLQVFLHGEVPCNDGGVSLGQAVIANFMVDHKR